MKRKLVFIGCFTWMMWGVYAQAQSYQELRQELQAKQERTREEINQLKVQLESYQTEISETEQKFEEITATLQALNTEIALREKVIQKLETERSSIREEISLNKGEYERQEKVLADLIASYKATLTFLYVHGRTSELSLLLTSKSFNQMLARSYYLKKFSEYRTAQLEEIDSLKLDLSQKIEELAQAQEKNERVLGEVKDEQQTLDQRKKEQQRLVASLQQNRKKLRQLLAETKQEISNLDETLTSLISEELELRKKETERIQQLEAERLRRLKEAEKITDAAKRRETVERYSKPVSTMSSVSLNEEEILAIEQAFSKQKGKLPWPVENGTIATPYGNIVHPVYRTQVINHGIEIATKARSSVYAIHDGVVFGVVPIPGYGDVIIVNHGSYNTVYGNLTEVFTRKNAIVRKGDLLAKSGDKNSPKGDVVFLMIRKDKQNLNPASWLVKK